MPLCNHCWRGTTMFAYLKSLSPCVIGFCNILCYCYDSCLWNNKCSLSHINVHQHDTPLTNVLQSRSELPRMPEDGVWGRRPCSDALPAPRPGAPRCRGSHHQAPGALLPRAGKFESNKATCEHEAAAAATKCVRCG